MKRQARTRRSSERLTSTVAAPGLQHLREAVGVIVDRLRRLVLLQAWERLKPTLNPGQVAQRILERQRVRLRRYASLDPAGKRSPNAIRVVDGQDASRNHVDEDPTASPSTSCAGSSADTRSANDVDATAASGRATSRTISRAPMVDSNVPGLGGDGSGDGMVISYRCSRSSPALSTSGGSANSTNHDITPAQGGSCFPKTRPLAIGGAGKRGEGKRGSCPRSSKKKGGERLAVCSASMVQQCFKEERASFIRDLQVLHRQLEAKDRESARCEKESRAAVARARLEARSAREQADVLRREAEKAAAAKAAAEATAQDLSDTVDKRSLKAESLRTLLRHCERQHAEEMELERRQQKAAAEEASAERRRLEWNVLTARKALSDGRREWAAEKDLVMAAVRDAGHRAELAAGEVTEAKTHAALLEERLQQTLEREAALNAEVDALRDSVRIGERRVAKAEADTSREQAAAAAQEESFLEYAKNLQEGVSQSEMMRGGEKMSRERLQVQLERAKEDAVAYSSKTQREMSATNMKVAVFQQNLALSRAKSEAMGRKLAAAETLLTDSSRASTKELEKRLNEAVKVETAGEMDALRSITGGRAGGPTRRPERERSLVEEQWRRREEDLLLLLHQAKLQKSGECADARDSEKARLADVMREIEDLRATVMRLSLEKETLLRQQSVVNASCDHAREEGSAVLIENRNDHARFRNDLAKGRPAAIFRSGVGGAYSVEDEAPLGVRSGGRDTESGHYEAAQGGARSPFQPKLRDHRRSPGLFHDEARTAADDERTYGGSSGFRKNITPAGEGEEGEGGAGRADKGERQVDNEEERHRFYYKHQHYRRFRQPRSAKEIYVFDTESATDDKCHSDGEETGGERPRKEEGGKFRAGTGNRCRNGWIGVNPPPTHAEDEELLAPRYGPAPVPSPLTLRHTRARQTAAPSLLRVSLEEERQRRRWEHDHLLALLREEGVSLEMEDSQREVEPDQRCLSFPGDASLRVAEGDRDTQGDDGKDSGARPLRHLEAGERRSSITEQYATPLTSEAWRDVVAALRRSLRLRQSARIYEGGRYSSEAVCTDVAAQVSLSPERSRDAYRIVSRFEGNGTPRSRRDCTSLWKGSVTGGGGDSDANVEVNDNKGEGDAATSSPALSGALVSTLRELLSSTLGVSEEGAEDVPLPDLIEALRRERETLLEGMAAMQEKVDRARQLADPATVRAAVTAAAQTDDFIPFNNGGKSTGETSLTVPLFASDERSKTGSAADLDASAAVRRFAELEADLDGAKREAARRLEETEREPSDATDRLAATLRDLAAERPGEAARLEVLTDELCATVASLTAAEGSAAAAREEAAESRHALGNLHGEVEGLKEAVESARRRAEVAEARVQELLTAAEEREADWAVDAERIRGEGWEQGRREVDQRVRALESSLEKLAEAGSAAKKISKEQMEVNRELSIERDGLAEENERIAVRLDQLTSALREQREEEAQLANQLSDRERGLEALRAEGDLERAKVARLHSEVEKAQGVCRDMADKLLELLDTQEELRATREKLAIVLQEVQSLRRSKDHLGDGWKEARRLRDCLDSAKCLGGEMSAKTEAAEARAERASRRARHLGARVDALQNQLDKVPNDLLVAHAEKRVLQAALEQATRNAADAKAAAEAEIRRRDADIRNFASAAAVQQERCGQRLREQSLTIHQLTLQGFSADAQADARVASPSATARVKTASGATAATSDATGTDRAGILSSDSTTEGGGVSMTGNSLGMAVAAAHTLRPVPRRAFFDSEEIFSGARGWCGRTSDVIPGQGIVDRSARGVHSDVAAGVAFNSSAERRPTDTLESGRERRRGVWEGHSLDSAFPTAKFGAPSGDEWGRR